MTHDKQWKKDGNESHFQKGSYIIWPMIECSGQGKTKAFAVTARFQGFYDGQLQKEKKKIQMSRGERSLDCIDRWGV